jgi:hypothetical protein
MIGTDFLKKVPIFHSKFTRIYTMLFSRSCGSFSIHIEWDHLTMSYFDNFDNKFLSKY